MVIVYHGKLEQIIREVDKVKPRLDARYVKILGKERAAEVAEAAKSLLRPESFYDNADKLNSDLGTNFPPDTPNKFFILCSDRLEFDDNGQLKKAEISTSPLFYVSEAGFQHSGSARFTNNLFASYVHEYNHFVWYTLQKRPLYLIKGALGNFSIESFLDYFGQIARQSIPYSEKKGKLQFACHSVVLGDIEEQTNRILDRMVLSSIGIAVPLPWRGEERRYVGVEIPLSEMRIFVPEGGDCFRGLQDIDVIRGVINWENFIKPKIGEHIVRESYFTTLLQSIRENLKVKRYPIDRFRDKFGYLFSELKGQK